MNNSITIACDDLNVALRTAVSYQAENREVQIKGRGKDKKVTYFVIVTEARGLQTPHEAV